MTTAQQLFDHAFSGYRTPRSPEYRAGCLYTLQRRLGELSDKHRCPHAPGTAQADAWFGGCEEGHEIARAHEMDRLGSHAHGQ